MKRKKDKRNQQTDNVQLNEPVAKEECHDREVVAESGNKVNDQTLSRGRKLVELSRKRKSNEPVKAPSKVAKRVAIPLELSDKGHKEERHRDRAQLTTGAPRFKELNENCQLSRRLKQLAREHLGNASWRYTAANIASL